MTHRRMKDCECQECTLWRQGKCGNKFVGDDRNHYCTEPLGHDLPLATPTALA